MNEYVYERETIEAPDGPYEQVWLCEPPEQGLAFRVLSDQWDFDLAIPVRKISCWVEATDDP